MSVARISINPAKFAIQDNDLPSEASDSEIDTDEWVTVSSSSTTSTITTLPSHLNLRLKPVSKARPVSPKIQSADGSDPQPPVPPPLPLPSKRRSTVQVIPPISPTSIITHPLQAPQVPHGSSYAAVMNLKTWFHNLTAIYIVSPQSIHPARDLLAASQRARIYQPLVNLTSITPHPPISTKATTPSGTEPEMFIRVCADCAKPSTTLHCDGTWTSSSAGICAEHSASMYRAAARQNQITANTDQSGTSTSHRTNVDVSEKLVLGRQYCPHHNSILSGCQLCNEDKDRALFADVLQAVAPFNRAATKLSGIDVFDMTVPVATEMYRHVSGCDCSRGRYALGET